MKAKFETITAIKVELNEEEAYWLQRYMQNPISSTELESKIDRENRNALYTTLKKVNIIFKSITELKPS